MNNKFKDIPIELFKILDTETNEFWDTYHGKCVWSKPAHAKAAWTQSHYRERIRFNDQTKYVIVLFSCDGWDIERLK